MTYRQPLRPHPADSSVLLHVRGVPFWGAIAIALVFGIGGLALASVLDTARTGWAFGILVVLGVGLAALAVRRGSIFTAMVQAPIIVTLLVFAAHYLAGDSSASHKSVIVTSGIAVVTSFPTMAIATGVGLLLGLVRIIAQPLRRGSGGRGADDHGIEPPYHQGALRA